jgi:hypothetical protein
MKVELSAYEKAINVLNEAPLHVDKKVCAAFGEFKERIAKLEAEVAQYQEELELVINQREDALSTLAAGQEHLDEFGSLGVVAGIDAMRKELIIARAQVEALKPDAQAFRAYWGEAN